jgi:two-component system sensor histidine kinase KdpD
MSKLLKSGYLMAVLGIAAATWFMRLFRGHVNATTVALALLIVVLLVATRWGARPAIAASLLAILCFNFFFLPPVGTFTIADTDNWVALGAFLVTAVTAGQLSARARRRAEEAEARRREVERLYKELSEAFERASHAEALRQSERLKSSLLDAVTHDLRTPLTSIKASVTTLLNELRGKGSGAQSLDHEGKREMLEVIDEETDRLNHFVESLVELARIEAGEMQLGRRWGAVDDIIMAALQRAEPLTRNHLIEVSVEQDLPLVRVDEHAVAEVIYSLVDNAAKYSAVGSRIRVAANRVGDAELQVSVDDEGSGIPVPLRARVFDKFFRVMPERDAGVTRASGIGMGLAIARGIVEAHGGRIWIDDPKNGVGTRVALTLPVGDEENAEVTAAPALGLDRTS